MSADEQSEKGKPGIGLQNVLLITCGVFALAVLVYGLIPQLLKPSVPDESTFIYEGWRIAQGALPYRDFFEFIGPGTLYVMGGLIKIFGLHILILRLSALLTALLCIFLTCKMARVFLPGKWLAALAVFLIIIFLPSGFSIQHHLHSAMLGLLATWLLFRSLAPECGHPNRDTVLAGFFSGLCLLFTQSLGGFLGLTLFAFTALHAGYAKNKGWTGGLIHAFKAFTLPAASPILLTALFFASQGGLDELYYDNIGWLMEGSYAQTTSHWYLLDGVTRLMSYSPAILRRLDIFFEAAMIFVQGWLPVLGMVWAGQVILDRFPGRGLKPAAFSNAQWRFLLLSTSAVAFFAANFSYPNTYLVTLHGWLQYALAFGALHNLAQRCTWTGTLLRLSLLVLLINRLAVTAEAAWHAYRTPGIISYGTVEKVLSPVGNTPEGVAAANSLLRFLHDNSPPGESIFIYNGAPEFYFMTNRLNPTRYQILMALYNTPAQISEAVSDLRRKTPEFILYNQADALNFQSDLRFLKLRNYDYRLHTLEKLLQDRYFLAAQMGNLLVFQLQPAFRKRKPAPE